MFYNSLTKSKYTKLSSKILYAVLNWGLGHASRSIPIIKNLIKQNKEIVIASDGDALFLLQKEFPYLIFETLASYNASYSKKAKNFDRTIFFQLSKFGKAIKKEHLQTQKLIKKHQITQIISDNRYGVYSKKIPSIIICHQVNLQHKSIFIQKQINKVHLSLLNKFNEIWIPDFKGEKSLAGEISSIDKSLALAKKIKYIGILSRMKKAENELEIIYKLCFILSGPEPQRTILENIFIAQLKDYKEPVVFVRGISNTSHKTDLNSNVLTYNLVNTLDLNKLINQSEMVVCRAGYSSIMDLVKLEKKAILIPTPGQTEQEYLANRLRNNKLFCTIKQDDFMLKTL